MELVKIKSSQLRQITNFINQNQLILHPVISPSGHLDFSNYRGRRFTVLLDRNLLSYLIELVSAGELENEKARLSICSIMLWAQINGIGINSGLALNEYAYGKGGNEEAKRENNLFLKTFNHYPVKTWLDLALNKRKSIPTLELTEFVNYSFHKDSDHFKMHYLEMLKIAQLYLDEEQSREQKIINFYQWIYDNILICRYTTIYLPLLLSGKVKTFKGLKNDFNKLIAKCQNQAWDLTYLSLWSTLPYSDKEADMIFLFGTLDTELKSLFINSHRNSDDVFIEILGHQNGTSTLNKLSNIYLPRDNKPMESFELDKMISEQLTLFQQHWENKTASTNAKTP